MNCFARFFVITALLVTLPLIAQDSQRKGIISGIVLDHDGKPVSDAIAKASFSGSFDGIVPTAKTDSSGRFVIEHLPFGGYFVTASKEQDRYPDESNAFYSGLNPHLVIVELDANHPQQVVTVRFGRKAAVIFGTVVDANSGEAVEPCAEFRRSDNPSITWSGTGLLKSTFHLLVPADTDFTITVWQRGYEPWFYKNESGTECLRVGSGKQVNLEIRMNPTKEKDRPPKDEEMKKLLDLASQCGCSMPPQKN